MVAFMPSYSRSQPSRHLLRTGSLKNLWLNAVIFEKWQHA